MGLLNQDEWTALGLLGNGISNRNFSGGATAAMGYLDQAPDRLLKQQYVKSQIDNYASEIEARKLKTIQDQRQQEFDQRFLGLGGPAGATPGAPNAAAMGGAPGAPGPSAGGFSAQQLAQQYNIPLEAVIADYKFNGGKKIAELISERTKPNWTNVNGNLVDTNARDFRGGMQAGLSAGNDGRVTAWQPNGRGGVVVGAPQGAFDTFSQYQNISEGAKAGQDLVKITGPDGAERYVTRAQAVQAAQPRPMMPQPPMQQPPQMRPQPGMTGSYTGSPEQAQAAIAGIRDPQERANAQAAFEEQARRTPNFGQGGPFQATPTSAQSAYAAALKTKAEADARAASEREAGVANRGIKASDMLTNLSRARVLLTAGNGPTASRGGAMVDSALGAVGLSTPSADAASALDNISGWLTSNVPRMEGPQSNFDVKNYETMSGRVGDRHLPVSQRLAALTEVENIQKRYAHLNGNQQGGNQQNLVAELPKNAPKGSRARDTTTGDILEFDGMSWRKAR